jgi:hypothetical protein
MFEGFYIVLAMVMSMISLIISTLLMSDLLTIIKKKKHVLEKLPYSRIVMYWMNVLLIGLLFVIPSIDNIFGWLSIFMWATVFVALYIFEKVSEEKTK